MERVIDTSIGINPEGHELPYYEELVLNDEEKKKLERNIERGEFIGGSYFAETVGSGAAGKMNEDSYAVFPMGKGRTLLAVFDGASSQKKIEGLERLEMSGAFYVSHLTSMIFRKSEEFRKLCQPDDITAEDVLKTINSWLPVKFDRVPGVDYSDPCSIPGMAAALVLIDVPNEKMTVAQVADTFIALQKQNGEIEVASNNTNERFDKETNEYFISLCEKYNIARNEVRKDPRTIQPYTGDGVSFEDSVRSLFNVIDENSDEGSVIDKGIPILDNDPKYEKIFRLKNRDDSTIMSVDISYKGINSLPLAG
ncbi:MAG: hypothetical protein UT76_C0039G0004 [Candidatus Woesebacteria bacterium GW2011_GWB1_40_12]|uniref:PPM-type phosphatase domain-containing protein n=1 Tax=Candidatus Woesebacteria bacterium GW2011_GWB1_40_12 TaxID=1618576 RepID=A0A0G0T0Y3_9BACT|nr:MAG: hypothetical protein UT76_C0039G0004 [Candidatus Woesebacteria bacterium GW2011_GWB1_40_12]